MGRETFSDLHHENPVDPQHIRLISEGGNSFVSCHRPVCIDSIQVSQTCTTESHHPAYRSAAGARSSLAAAATALFSIPPEHADELDQGLLPAVLRTRFGQQGVFLSEATRVDVVDHGRFWHVVDGDSRFSIRKNATHLTVHRDSE